MVEQETDIDTRRIVERASRPFEERIEELLEKPKQEEIVFTKTGTFIDEMLGGLPEGITVVTGEPYTYKTRLWSGIIGSRLKGLILYTERRPSFIYFDDPENIRLIDAFDMMDEFPSKSLYELVKLTAKYLGTNYVVIDSITTIYEIFKVDKRWLAQTIAKLREAARHIVLITHAKTSNISMDTYEAGYTIHHYADTSIVHERVTMKSKHMAETYGLNYGDEAIQLKIIGSKKTIPKHRIAILPEGRIIL